MQPCRLVAENLAVRRGDRVLLRGIDVALDAGAVLHLAGPNGIGKSSLLRIFAGLLRPFAGTVSTLGAIGLSDERLPLDGHQPLGRALDFWRRIDGAGAADADFGLDDLGDVPVRYLSTGQRKRAALACLAASGARIWLLDEPLNGLDKDWATTARNLIAHHCAGGGIAVIASHLALDLDGLAVLALINHVPAEPAQ